MTNDVFNLSDLEFPKLKLVHEKMGWRRGQDHSRWILRTRKNHPFPTNHCLYFKLWNSTYVRRDNILRGLDSGFYDDSTTPAFAGLVYHRGVCRGYVMYGCKQYRKMDAQFYRLIQQKTESTGLFHIQFSRFHLFRFDNRFTLIDLEGIYSVNELYSEGNPWHFDDVNYARFVHRLKNGTDAPPVVNDSALLKSIQFPYRKSLSFYRRFSAWTITQWSNTFNHVDLIER